MAILQTMYPGVANSPDTFLKEDLTKDAAVMYLSDGSVLGTLPTLAVIGGGADAETVLVTSTAADGGFTIQRGVEGEQKAWKKADLVARNWTNKDYETVRANIETVNANVLSEASKREYSFNVLSQSINQLNTDFSIAMEDKVDKVDGKGLSTNDYDAAAKAKVDGIPANPKYTDTVADLTPYAKKADVPTKLSQLSEDSTHRLVTDAEKAKVQAIPTNPKYTDTIPDLTPYAKKTEIPDLTPYAKKTDIKTSLADMAGDTSHRTVTDDEKKAWNEKVDAAAGKGLSTNDLTDELLQKLSNVKEQVILTQAEYDKLPTDQKNDPNKIYFIKA